MQKFNKGDKVKVADDLGEHMSHFQSGMEAIVIGSYKDQYGGSDTESYTIHIQGQGETSWYYEHQMELVEKGCYEELDNWEKSLGRKFNRDSQFRRELHNPKELIAKLWPDADSSHITYDENFNNADRDYWVRRQTGHDGTSIFTIQMFEKAFIELMNKQAAPTHRLPDPAKNLVDIKYVIGPMKHATVFGQVKLGCSETNLYPGQKERVKMAVKVEYVYQD